MINHRYAVLKRLGEGGNGEVFLVEDSLDVGRRSAMKVLRHADEQFANEVGALTALRHPNLVRIFDVGTVRQTDLPSLVGKRFLVMEYLEGADVLEWCCMVPSEDARAQHISHIVGQVLGALSVVHRRGIIHFDIKPGNLFVVPSGDREGLPFVKLTDFGFSIAEDPAGDAPVRGTLEYTAPELLRREPFDHRVDLYSLGAALYHLIEGRCPFEASTAVDLVRAALTVEPVFQRARLSPYASFLPLLTALLAKDPARRPADADAALRLLMGEQGAAGMQAVQSPPSFVGRARECMLIGEAIARLADAGTPGTQEVIVIQGIEGMGKTALLGRIAWDARTRDIPVLTVEAGGTGVPFSDILPAVQLLRCELQAREGGRVAWMTRCDDAISAASRAVARERTAQELARFFLECSGPFPVLVLADDCDRLDTDSLDVLRRVAHDPGAGRRLMLCATAAGMPQGFPETALRLDELTEEEMRSMSASVLAPRALAEVIAGRIYRLYGGLPAIGVEVLRMLGPLVAVLPAVDTERFPALADEVMGRLPGTIEQILLRRYEGLSGECRLAMGILACVEHPARLELLQAALPMRTERIVHSLAVLEAEGFVQPADGGRRYTLRHAKLGTLLHSKLEAPAEVHGFLAGVLAQESGDMPLQDREEAAFQFAQSGNGGEAAHWYEHAADAAALLGAFDRAARLYETARRFADEAMAQSVPHLTGRLAAALYESGRYAESTDEAERLLAVPGLTERLRASLHRSAGLSYARLGEYRRAQDCLTAALGGTAEEREQLELELELAGTAVGLADFAGAERACSALRDRAVRLGDETLLGAIYTQLGIASFYQEKSDASIEWFRKAMEVYAGALRNDRVADALMNIGNVLSARGETTDAIRHWQDALPMSREFGTLNQQAQIQNNLGIAHYTLKKFPEAKQYYAGAQTLFSRVGSREGMAYVLTNLGEVSFAEGEYEDALTRWTDACGRYEAMGDARGQVESLLQIAQVCLVIGDGEQARARLAAAGSLITEKGIGSFTGELEFLGGDLHLMEGDIDAAVQCYKTALEAGSGSYARRRLLLVRSAACARIREPERAVELLQNALAPEDGGPAPAIVAEAMLVMAEVVRGSPRAETEKPVALLVRGFEAIAREPVSELTWRLAVALGREFRDRGNSARSREFFAKARAVLRYLLGRFTTAALRTMYSGSGGRADALAEIDNVLAT